MESLPYRTIALALVVAFLILASGREACGKDRDVAGEERAAAAFYDIYLKVKSSGVPETKELSLFKPVLSEGLYEWIAAARRAEDTYRKETRGESPPLIEGDLFTSLFEGAEGYELQKCRRKPGSAECIVKLRHTDPADGSAIVWKDKVRLVKTKQGWRVDDIEYLGTWEFMHRGTLKKVLSNAIEDSRVE